MGRAKKDVMRKDIRKMVKGAISDNAIGKDSKISCAKESKMSCAKAGLADLIKNRKS